MSEKQITTENGVTLRPRACPLCENLPFDVIGRGYDYDYRMTTHLFEYRRCTKCNSVFPDFEPIYGQLHKVYTKNSHWNDKRRAAFRATGKRQLRFRNGRLINRLSKFAAIKPNFKLLDIGSGRGDLFSVIVDKFPQGEYHSVDLTNEVGNPKVKHYNGYFEDCDFGDLKFDVITSQHNIEHVYSPIDYLSKASSLLTDQGFIFIVTPNVEALEFKILQKKLYCAGWSPPRHLTLFSENSFKTLVRKVGNLQIEWMGHFFTIHHWMGLVHHITYDWTKSDKADKWLDFNNVFLSVPFYLFDLIRYILGIKTGVLEISLTKVK